MYIWQVGQLDYFYLVTGKQYTNNFSKVSLNNLKNNKTSHIRIIISIRNYCLNEILSNLH
jgi:hypothetical protein